MIVRVMRGGSRRHLCMVPMAGSGGSSGEREREATVIGRVRKGTL